MKNVLLIVVSCALLFSGVSVISAQDDVDLPENIHPPEKDIFEAVSEKYDELEDRGDFIEPEPDVEFPLTPREQQLVDEAEKPFGDPEDYPDDDYNPLPNE